MSTEIMNRQKAEAILAKNTTVFLRRHPGSAIMDIDGDLNLKELQALVWLLRHCPDWEVGV